MLVGGAGTRLREVVADRPKPLAEVAGRPFLSYLLDQVERAGVRRVVLCSGYMAGVLEAALGSRHGSLALEYSAEDEPLGTGGALRRALPKLSSDVVLVLNGDSYCDVDLAKFAAFHEQSRAEASIVATRVENAAAFGRVKLGTDGRIEAFEEKDGRSEAGLINAGIYLLKRGLIEAIPATGAVSLERAVFPSWIGKAFYGYACAARFIDIGTPASYRAAEAFFRWPMSART